jgi:DNA-binding transcriptional LysR family regulator
VAKQRIDLNLFRIFEAVMRHRSVSDAGRELGVTPSAVSHALSRLRQELADDLFVPGAAGMEPTARARDLTPRIREGLSKIDDAVGSKPFVPFEAARTFRIAATEYSAVTVLGPLVTHIVKAAPQITLRVFPYSRMDVVRNIDDGRVDLVMGWFGEIPDRMGRTTIRVDREAVVVRPGHPLTHGQVTKEHLLAFSYVVVEMTGSGEPPSDGFLDERSVQRRVWIERLLINESADREELSRRMAVTVPYYAAVPYMLRATDMVATLPMSLARRAMAQGLVAILDLPYEPLEVSLEAIWHRRAERDAGLQWLIGEMIDVAREASDA